jgi:micrococcal nuclease
MRNLSIYTTFILILLLAPVPAVAQRNALPTVVSVGDGDTLRVKDRGQIITIRLGCVDSLELAQKPWGEQARNRLRQLLPPGQAVQVREIERDRYGRTVAEVFLGNQLLNLQLVREGQAVVYRQYLDGCAANKDQYLQAEAQAKQQRRGFWSQPSPVRSWNFRQGKRGSNQPSSTPSRPASRQTNLPACVNSECDCSDFKTQAQAQQVLNAFTGDPHRLDQDKDRVACESLP